MKRGFFCKLPLFEPCATLSMEGRKLYAHRGQVLMRASRRGALLIVSLFFVLLVAMFVSASLLLGRGGQFAGAQSEAGESAEMAARSGIQYCLARLVENPAWRGDGNARVVDTPSLIAEEDNGNVIGLITQDGRVSQFRVRFNYQDDAQGNADGLPDPNLVIDHEWVSVNNLLNNGLFGLPLADGPGYSVQNSSPRRAQIPAHTVALVVEGRAGPGLRDFNPNVLSAAPAGSVYSRVLETTYRIDSILGLDAGTQAGGSIQARFQDNTGALTVNSADSEQTARVRSKGHVSVRTYDGSSNARYVSDDGEVMTADGALTANYDSAAINVATEDPAAGFYELQWDEIRRAGTGDETLAAGIYVWWDDGSLHYYDRSYDDYVTFITANPTDGGTVVDPSNLSQAFEVDLANRTMTVRQDLLIAPTANGTRDFAVIPRSGAQEEPDSAAASQQLSVQYPSSVSSAVAYYNQMQDYNMALHALLIQIAPQGGNFNGSQGGSISWYPQQPYIVINGGQYLEDFFGGSDTFQAAGGVVNPLYANLVQGQEFSLDVTGLNSFLTQQQQQGQVQVLSPAPGAIDLGSITDDLNVTDLELHFKPAEGESAVLSSSGNVRIGAGVFGTGGSITSEGDIRIVGARTDLAANPNGAQGVNLYAQGDIILSALAPDPNNPGNFVYHDFDLKGVIYTWSNFSAQLGYQGNDVSRWGSLNIEGALVAYGGDPSEDEPGANGGGVIDLVAGSANVTFDPGYLAGLQENPTPSPLDRLYWNRLR